MTINKEIVIEPSAVENEGRGKEEGENDSIEEGEGEEED